MTPDQFSSYAAYLEYVRECEDSYFEWYELEIDPSTTEYMDDYGFKYPMAYGWERGSHVQPMFHIKADHNYPPELCAICTDTDFHRRENESHRRFQERKFEVGPHDPTFPEKSPHP